MLLAYKLRKVRSKEEASLNEINKETFKNLSAYILNSHIKEVEKEEALNQIMDMILQAQNENKDLNLIIGKDHEKFCAEVVEEYYLGKPLLYRILNYIQRSTLVICICLFFVFFIKRHLDIDQVIEVILWIVIIYPLLMRRKRKRIFIFRIEEEQRHQKMDECIFFIITLVVTIFILIILVDPIIDNVILNNISNKKINLFSNPLYILLLIALMLGIQVYKKVVDRK